LCVQECYAEALEILGDSMSVSRVLNQVMRDKPFYDVSGGGMTISGGEPMEQFEFTQALLRGAKENGLHTCLETNGHTPFERYRELLKLVDIFLYDLKGIDSSVHQEQVGVGCELILENMERIDACGGKSILRCPIIPGFNDREDHFLGIAAAANGLHNVIEIELLPYHSLGRSKSFRIGKEYLLSELPHPDESTVSEWLRCIQGQTNAPVRCS
jgi:pyruvate formate lyase activating enzyme